MGKRTFRSQKSKHFVLRIIKIVNKQENIIEFRGYGYDENALAIGAPMEAASFANYGLVIMIEDNSIVRAQLNMFDRHVSIVYLK